MLHPLDEESSAGMKKSEFVTLTLTVATVAIKTGRQSLSQSAGVGWTCVEHSCVLGMRKLKRF